MKREQILEDFFQLACLTIQFRSTIRCLPYYLFDIHSYNRISI